MKKYKNNQGFTLVEVLLSIVILAILLMPALNSFATIAKVNKKSNIEQKASTLAQNILESLETMSLSETSKQFSGTQIFDIISSNLNGFADNYTMKSWTDGGFGEYKLDGYNYIPADAAYLAQADRTMFYYVLKGVTDHGTTFDAMITLDISIYSTSKYDGTMNNFKMPRLLELDDKSIAIIDLNNSSDSIAKSEFKLKREGYITALANIVTPTVKPGDPTPIPTPALPEITIEQIKDSTKKNIFIELSKDAVNQVVNVVGKVQYICELDLNEDGNDESSTISEIFRGTYPIPTASTEDGNVYLFYTPSEFTGRDTINITNNGAKVNFYLANQTETLASNIKVKSIDTNSGITMVYTNYSGTLINNFAVTNEKIYSEKNDNQRIYSITVSIYPEGSINSYTYTNPYVTFTTAKEN